VKTPKSTRETLELSVRQLMSADYPLFASSPVLMVAVRGFHLDMGAAGKNDRGIYDDAFFLLCGEELIGFPGNCDPSVHRPGIAQIEANQLIWYRPGWHGCGKPTGHRAFRQDSRIIVRRDGGRGPGKPLGNGRFQDSDGSPFWCNLHRGGAKGGTSSLGCLTVPDSVWPSFYNLLTLKLKIHKQARLPLFLINALFLPPSKKLWKKRS
jgi:hypothetical protein